MYDENSLRITKQTEVYYLINGNKEHSFSSLDAVCSSVAHSIYLERNNLKNLSGYALYDNLEADDTKKEIRAIHQELMSDFINFGQNELNKEGYSICKQEDTYYLIDGNIRFPSDTLDKACNKLSVQLYDEKNGLVGLEPADPNLYEPSELLEIQKEIETTYMSLKSSFLKRQVIEQLYADRQSISDKAFDTQLLNQEAWINGESMYPADFSYCDLKGRSFENMDLRGANFIGAIIDDCNFSGAKLDNAKFYTFQDFELEKYGINSEKVLTAEKYLQSLEKTPTVRLMSDIEFEEQLNIQRKLCIEVGDFGDRDPYRLIVDLYFNNIKVGDFSNRDLTGRSFKGQNLKLAKFNGSILKNCDFTESNTEGADFSHLTKSELQELGIADVNNVCSYESLITKGYLDRDFMAINDALKDPFYLNPNFGKIPKKSANVGNSTTLVMSFKNSKGEIFNSILFKKASDDQMFSAFKDGINRHGNLVEFKGNGTLKDKLLNVIADNVCNKTSEEVGIPVSLKFQNNQDKDRLKELIELREKENHVEQVKKKPTKRNKMS